MGRFAALATFFVLAASPAPGVSVSAPGIVPPLADPAVAPGVGRCTSDGACTVTGEDGTTRAASRLSPSR